MGELKWLRPMALSLLVSPSSSSYQERVFSDAGEIGKGKRSRSSVSTIERRTMIKHNLHLYSKPGYVPKAKKVRAEQQGMRLGLRRVYSAAPVVFRSANSDDSGDDSD